MAVEGGDVGLLKSLLGVLATIMLAIIGWAYRLSIKVAEHGRDIPHALAAAERVEDKLDKLDEKFDEIIQKLSDILSTRRGNR